MGIFTCWNEAFKLIIYSLSLKDSNEAFPSGFIKRSRSFLVEIKSTVFSPTSNFSLAK